MKMENKIKEVTFQMRISSLNVLKFSQYDIEGFEADKEDLIEYQSNINFTVLEESSEVAIEITVKLKNTDLNALLGELKVLMKFHITPLSEVITKKEDDFEIPDAVVSNLITIVAGTVRGILYEKLRGTPLQGQVFPLIDVKELIQKKKQELDKVQE